MRNEYAFKITETNMLVVYIEADSEADAKVIIEKMLDNGEILMDEGKFNWTVAAIRDDEVKNG